MVTNVGVVYSIDDKSVLRVVVPDTDTQLEQQTWTGPGEALYKMGVDLYSAQPTPDDLIHTLVPILALL